MLGYWGGGKVNKVLGKLRENFWVGIISLSSNRYFKVLKIFLFFFNCKNIIYKKKIQNAVIQKSATQVWYKLPFGWFSAELPTSSEAEIG